MKLFCLRSYSTGYLGFIDDGDQYAYFRFSRRGKLRILAAFPKKQYQGYRHFIGGMSKYMPYIHFFERPVPFDPVSIQELDRIHTERAAN